MVKLRGWLISHYKNDRPIDGKRPSVPRYPRPQDNFASPVPVHPSYPKQEKMASLQDFKVECIKYQKVISSNVCNNSGYVPEAGSEVFVKNLPFFVSDEEMVEFFSKVGVVYRIKIMMEETGDKNRGFCYVTYMDSSMAKTAIRALKYIEFQKDVYLVIENSMNNCRIFMGGIPTHKTKDEVWQELYKNGVKNIVDVIMYRSYTERSENRGFVFIEFQTHEQAAHFRAKYHNALKLWGFPIIVDWSIPIPEVEDSILKEVKILYLRNLDVTMTPQEVEHLIWRYIRRENIQKVYKFKNYAFIHVKTRELAEGLKDTLKGYFKNTPVEVEWAKPTSKYTSPDYRQFQVRNLTKSRYRTTSTSSNRSLNEESSIFESESSRKFIPSPQSLQERRSLDRYRYSSTGSYDFLESPGSSSSSTTPTSSSNELSPSDGDIVKGTDGQTSHRSPWKLPSPVPCYAEFCSTPSSRSSTPNSPLNPRGLLNMNDVMGSSSTYEINRLNQISRFENLNLNPSPNFELQNLNQNSYYTNPGLEEAQNWNILVDPTREYQRLMSNIFPNNKADEQEDMFTCKFCKLTDINH